MRPEDAPKLKSKLKLVYRLKQMAKSQSEKLKGKLLGEAKDLLKKMNLQEVLGEPEPIYAVYLKVILEKVMRDDVQ